MEEYVPHIIRIPLVESIVAGTFAIAAAFLLLYLLVSLALFHLLGSEFWRTRPWK